MNTLIIVLVIALVGWWTRNLYFRKLNSRYRYRLYSFRDKLRLLAIEKEIKSDSLKFDFLDQAISKSIQYLDCLNIYTLAYLSIKVSKDKNFVSFSEIMSKKLDDDKILCDFYRDFNKITHEYIKERFLISFFVFNSINNYFLGYSKLVEIISRSFWNLTMMMRFLPKEKPVPIYLRHLLL